ncbi:MAG: hypothetical protein K2X74_21435 [Acetobacteraceae bacterium]|nr:hypothetical protein [Acetobacteraceae bacterium]
MSKSRLPPIPPGSRAPMGGAGKPGGARAPGAAEPGKAPRNSNPAAQAGQGKLRASSMRPVSRGGR